MSDCIDEATVGHVYIESGEYFVDRVALRQLVQELHVQRLDLFVNDGAEWAQTKAPIRGRHFDANVSVAGSSYSV